MQVGLHADFSRAAPYARPGTLRHERTRSHQERETAPGRMALTPANDGTKDGAGPGPLARYANGTVDNAGGLVTMDDHNLFEIIDTTRSMRRLKPDPIPDEVVERIIRAGTKAPSGQNTQPWAFLVVRDAAAKGFIQERYLEVMERAMGDRKPAPDERSRDSRGLRAAWHLASHLHETPVLLLVCGKRDWPFAIAHEDRKGLAPPAYGSTLPAVQNILLACRALGLGATLTTLHQMFEGELRERFAIPEAYGVVAMIPIGYPSGRFGPVRRRPVREVTHLDRWGSPWPG